MAPRVVTGTLGATVDADGAYTASGGSASSAGGVSPSLAADSATLTTDAASLATHNTSATTNAAAVAAAVAALVADGASPTQGHVNTLNTAYGLLATDLINISADSGLLTTDAASIATDSAASVGANTSNLILVIDTAVLTTSNKIKAALRAATQVLKNSGLLA